MADALSKLLPQGLRVKAQQVWMRLGLDDPEGDDEILGGGTSRAEPDSGVLPEMARAVARAAARRNGRGTGAIDAAVEDLLSGDGWEPLMDPLLSRSSRKQQRQRGGATACKNSATAGCRRCSIAWTTPSCCRPFAG